MKLGTELSGTLGLKQPDRSVSMYVQATCMNDSVYTLLL